jgi:sugar fermentation stimulation protein A
VPGLADYATVRAELPYAGGSRVDFQLIAPGRPDAYVEVKNLHFGPIPGRAAFPDGVLARGATHRHALAEMVAAGRRAVLPYGLMRGDCASFEVARDVDPADAAAQDAAPATRVETLCLTTRIDTAGAAPGALLSIPG